MLVSPASLTEVSIAEKAIPELKANANGVSGSDYGNRVNKYGVWMRDCTLTPSLIVTSGELGPKPLTSVTSCTTGE